MLNNFLNYKVFTLFILSILICSPAFYAEATEEAAYVGSEGCKCHKSEISDWEMSKHAKAFDLLKAGKRKSKKKKAGLDPDKDYTTDEKCIPCHVTGYKKDGGFTNSVSTPALAGVGCESCHGAGGKYRILHKDKSLDFTKNEAIALGELYGSLDSTVCESCHRHKDNPFKAEIDEKYNFIHAEALKNTRTFHDYYELDGKH